MLWLHAQMCVLNDAVHKESKRATYVLSSAVCVLNWANPGLWELQAVSITVLMQMQVIKQNSGANHVMQSDMQDKAKVGTQNNANTSDRWKKTKRVRKTMQSKRKRKRVRKTVQTRKKTKTGMQNSANASDMQRKQMQTRKTMQMQAKTNAGMQNNACNANEEAMNAMQWFRWAYLKNLRPDLK